MKISTITIGDFDIEITYNKGKLAYTFEYDGQSYGQATKLESKDVLTIASTVAVLIVNAIETRKELCK
jgi:hypothetical protein